MGTGLQLSDLQCLSTASPGLWQGWDALGTEGDKQVLVEIALSFSIVSKGVPVMNQANFQTAVALFSKVIRLPSRFLAPIDRFPSNGPGRG